MRNTAIGAIAAIFVLFAGAFGTAGAQAPTPVAGTDYIEISTAARSIPSPEWSSSKSTSTTSARPATRSSRCSLAWAAKLPADVKLVHVPASFRADFVQYAKAYYAAQNFKVAERIARGGLQGDPPGSHVAGRRPTGRTKRRSRPFTPPVRRRRAAVSRRHAAALPWILKVRRAAEHMTRTRIPSTPSIVVNGRYLVQGNTYQDMLRIADFLIEKERAAAASSGG